MTAESERAGATASRRMVAWLAATIAAVELITFGLQVSGVFEQMLIRADTGGTLGVHNFVFVILPALLSFGLLVGLWWVFRGTKGHLPAFVAIAIGVISQALSNLWPFLTGWGAAGQSLLMWMATASGLILTLAIAIAVAWSGMLPRHVVLLGFALFALHALAMLAGLVLHTWQSAFIPFVPQVEAGIQGVRQYGGTAVQVAFLLSFAFALLATKAPREQPPAGV